MELNRANRQTCDVDIKILSTMKPFLKFKTANTTTAGLEGSSVYAMAKGTRKIGFPDPIQGTMTIEAQVYPFKFFSLLSNGVIHSDAVYSDSQEITATSNGTLDVAVTSGTIEAGTLFVYPKDAYGDDDMEIKGTYAEGTFTATTTGDIVAGQTYIVGYMVNKTANVRRISFNNKNLPQDYYITQTTVDKDELGVFTPFVMTAYKATIQRTFDLSFSSEGDPATVTLTFDLMEDKDGNIFDMLEVTDDVAYTGGMTTSYTQLAVTQGLSSRNIGIVGATGAVTASFKTKAGVSATGFTAHFSGDYDTVIVDVSSSATAGDYVMTLTDSTTGTAQTADVAITVLASAT